MVKKFNSPIRSLSAWRCRSALEDELLEDDDEDFNSDEEGDLECFDPDEDDPIIWEMLGDDLLALLEDELDECFELLDECLDEELELLDLWW